MPPAGTGHRADQTATVQRLAHELFTDTAVGVLLDELTPLEESLDPDSDDAALIRLTRRDYEKAVKVPASLRAAMARAAAEARPVWVKAKAESDFASFLPSLQQIVELKLEYVDRVADGAAERYDVLLDDYEPQKTTAEVRTLFEDLKPPLVELIAELRERDMDDAFLHGDFPPDRQRALSREVVELFGHRPDRASGCVRYRTQRYSDHHQLPPRHARVAPLHDARVRPRPLRPPAAAAPRAAADRTGLLARDPRVAEPALGEPRRPEPAVLAALLSAPARDVSRAARRSRPRPIPRRHPHRPARPDPDPGRRGDLRDARHAPLRARAGHRREPRRAARPAATMEREDVRVPRRRRPRRRPGRAPGRPLVGWIDRLLLDVPDRHRRLGADLGGGTPRRAGAGGAGRPRRVRTAARMAP